MRVINVYEENASSQLLAAVVAGEEIVIARAGRPLAKLVPYRRPWRPVTRVLARSGPDRPDFGPAGGPCGRFPGRGP